MKHSALHKARNWLLRFFQVQLFITLFSMPILLAWGLPLSLLSPIGNLISSPFLMLFLLLSSLVFFSQLLQIPNDWLIWLLEKTTCCWLYLLKSANIHRWNYGFAQPPTWVLIACLCATIVIIYHRKTRGLYTSIICFTLLFSVLCTYSFLTASISSRITTLPCNKGNITVIHDSGSCVVIDPGVIGQRISAPSWTQYTLIPQLIQKTGKISIDHLILLKPGTMLFQAIERLCSKMQVKNMYLAKWEGTLAPSAEENFERLIQTCKKYRCNVTLVDGPTTITLADNSTIELQPLPKKLKKDSAHYPALAARAQIDNQKITIYPAKYMNKLPKKSQHRSCRLSTNQ